MGKNRRHSGAQVPRRGPRQELVLARAAEVIRWMRDHDGYTKCTKAEAAKELAHRFGPVWQTSGGRPNRSLLVEVIALMHDQHEDPEIADRLDGCMIEYSPNLGGLTMVDSRGAMDTRHLALTLGGDLDIQQKARTVVRRRSAGWRSLAAKAFALGWFDMARVAVQIEREIDTSGFVPDDLVHEYQELVDSLPPGPA